MKTSSITSKNGGWNEHKPQSIDSKSIESKSTESKSKSAKTRSGSKTTSTKMDPEINLFKNSQEISKKTSSKTGAVKTGSSTMEHVDKMVKNTQRALSLINPVDWSGKAKLAMEAGRVIADSAKEYRKEEGGVIAGARSFAKDTVSIFKELVDDDKKAGTSGPAKTKATKEDDALNKIWGVISKSKSVEAAIDGVGDLGRKRILTEFKETAVDKIRDWLGFGGKSAQKTAGAVAGAADDIASAAAAAGGAAKTAGAAGAAAAEAGSLLSKLPGLASKALGAFGAAYSAYSLWKNFGKISLSDGAMNGAAVGAFAGSFFGPVGITVGGIAGGLIGGALSFFKGGKNKDQVARDSMREGLQTMGVLDDKFGLGLADGSRFDMSRDGGATLSSTDGSARKPYEVDLADQRASEVVGWVNPLAHALAGDNEKIKTDLAGYLTNAALSNATTRDEARANVMKFYQDSSVNPAELVTVFDAGVAEGRVSEDTGVAYINGLSELYSQPDVQ